MMRHALFALLALAFLAATNALGNLFGDDDDGDFGSYSCRIDCLFSSDDRDDDDACLAACAGEDGRPVLPPDTAISLLATVASSTVASTAYWAEKCKNIPSHALFIAVKMGSALDFFRPVDGHTFCDMLTSRTKHQWSPNGLAWTTPDFYSSHFGGSASYWPRDKGRSGDDRKHLSFWGSSSKGGCCASSYSTSTTAWEQPFTVSYAVTTKCIGSAHGRPCQHGGAAVHVKAPKELTVSGYCSYGDLNGKYSYQGLVKSGTPYYMKTLPHPRYLYHDDDCSGTGYQARWIFDGDKPSLTATSHLGDRTKVCSNFGSISSTSGGTSLTVPSGYNSWRTYCGPSAGRIDDTINVEPSDAWAGHCICECAPGFIGTHCEDYENKCPDGSDGLTIALYEAAVRTRTPSLYAGVTCIPAGMFKNYDSDVTLTGLDNLISIEREAFYSMDGILKITGSYPALEKIGQSSFYYAGSSYYSKIAFTGLPSLSMLDYYAFRSFMGELTFTGAYPLLQSIGYKAFDSAGDDDSTIAITCSSGSTLDVGLEAFADFDGMHDSSSELCTCPNEGGRDCLSTSTTTSSSVTMCTAGLNGEVCQNNGVADTVSDEVTVSGACAHHSEMNGKYSYQGKTKSGKPYYKGGKSGTEYIYHDEDCGDDYDSARWIIDEAKPSTTAEVDLDQDGECNYRSHIASSSPHVPQGSNLWVMDCLENGKTVWTSRVLTIRGAGIGHCRCACPYGFTGDNCEEFTEKCPDGSEGLHQGIYAAAVKAGDPAMYADVSCIPEDAFHGYDGDVTLVGLKKLTSIDRHAFRSFSGTLSFSGTFSSFAKLAPYTFYYFGGTLHFAGDYPELSIIGSSAFYNGGNENSTVEFSGLPKLALVEDDAFKYFDGDVTISGNYPLLEVIESEAFEDIAGTFTFSGSYPSLALLGSDVFSDAGNENSTIEITGLPVLNTTGRSLFYSFDGKLTFTGNYPALETIEYSAFSSAGNKDSVINLPSLPNLISVESKAFYSFDGTLIFAGNYPALETIESNAFDTSTFSSLYSYWDDDDFWASFGLGGGSKLPDREESNNHSKIEMSNLLSLVSVDKTAFDSFQGNVSLVGPFPKFVGCIRLSGSASNNVLHPPAEKPLTITLYESGDQSELDDVTCIPTHAFKDYGGKVELTGMKRLASIEDDAFGDSSNTPWGTEAFSGALSISGEYPMLAMIGANAFKHAGDSNSTSTIVFDGLRSLVDIGDHAFNAFKGDVRFDGAYPSLERIGHAAFHSAGIENSSGVAIACTVGSDLLTGRVVSDRDGDDGSSSSYAYGYRGGGGDDYFNFWSNDDDDDDDDDLAETCKCHGHAKDGSGGPDCASVSMNKKYCYVEPNVCSDSIESSSETMPGSTTPMHYSFSACKGQASAVHDPFTGFKGAHNASGELCSCFESCAPCWVPTRPKDDQTCTTTSTLTSTTTTASTTTTSTATTTTSATTTTFATTTVTTSTVTTTTVTTTTVTTTTGAGSLAISQGSKDSNGTTNSSLTAIVGAVLGVLLLIIVAVFIVYTQRLKGKLSQSQHGARHAASRNRPQPGPHGRAPVAAAFSNPAFDAGSDMPMYEEMDGASGQQGGFGGPGYDGLATTPPGDALYGGDSTYDAAPASATVYRVPDPLPPDGALGESYEDIGPTGRCNDCNAKMKFCVCRVRRSTADMPTLRKARARKGDPTQQCTYKKGACRSKQSASPGAYCTNHSCTSCSGPKRSSEESCGSCDAGRGRSATLQRPRTNTNFGGGPPESTYGDLGPPGSDGHGPVLHNDSSI